MGSNWLSLNRLGITSRLMLWFLAISLIPCSLLTLVNNYLSVRSLERSVRSQLASISSAKTTELDNFIREPAATSRSSARRLEPSRRPRSCRKAGTKNELREAIQLAKGIDSSIRRHSASWKPMDMQNLYLFAADSRLLFRVKSDLNVGETLLSGPLKGTELAEVFERSKMLLQSEVSDYPGLSRSGRTGSVHCSSSVEGRARSSASSYCRSVTARSTGFSAIMRV